MHNEKQRRHCILTSAGDRNSVASWLGHQSRSWDLITIYYGEDNKIASDLANISDRFFSHKGSKFQNLHAIWRLHSSVLEAYDYVWIMDDDIVVDQEQIETMFAMARRWDFWVCQPAFSRRGKISHAVTARDPSSNLFRYVNFVEVTCPLFRQEQLLEFLREYDPELTCWGVDHWFAHLLQSDKMMKFAVIDMIEVTNPHDGVKGGKREIDRLLTEEARKQRWNEVRTRRRIPHVRQATLARVEGATSSEAKNDVATLHDLLKTIESSPQVKALGSHVSRTRLWNNICAVVDIAHRGVKFAIDFKPLPAGVISAVLVERPHALDFRVTSKPNGRETLVEGVAVADALDLMQSRVLQILKSVDRYLDTPPARSNVFLHNDETTKQPSSPPGSGLEKHSPGMKVGVLTLPLHTNVGGHLQAYALMQVLRQLGHEPVLLNRRDPTDKRTPIRRFVEKHIGAISGVISSGTALQKYVNDEGFNAIVVGSDQVWRPLYAGSILRDFFFDFIPGGSTSIRRIAYAASFGSDRWGFSAEQTNFAARLSEHFHAVSVREDSAVKFCRDHLGVEAQHVLDPTLLLSPSHYRGLYSSDHPGAGKLVAYVLDQSDDKIRIIDSLAAKLSIGAYRTNGQVAGSCCCPRIPGQDQAVNVARMNWRGERYPSAL